MQEIPLIAAVFRFFCCMLHACSRIHPFLHSTFPWLATRAPNLATVFCLFQLKLFLSHIFSVAVDQKHSMDKCSWQPLKQNFSSVWNSQFKHSFWQSQNIFPSLIAWDAQAATLFLLWRTNERTLSLWSSVSLTSLWFDRTVFDTELEMNFMRTLNTRILVRAELNLNS